MKYRDLREFVANLEKIGALKRVRVPVSPVLQMTEICDRLLKSEGPAVVFEKPVGHTIHVLGNLFGTTERVALAMGAQSISDLRDIGRTLAALREPEPPRGLKDAARL